MEVRVANLSDLEAILEIYAYARRFMAEHGNASQWGTTNPPKERILQDIKEGKCHLCEEGEKIAAVFYFAREVDPTYVTLLDGAWINESEYAVVHRVASAPNTKGAATFALNWAYSQWPNIKIDTHADNIPMQHLLEKLGFIACGHVHIADGSTRIAYQKSKS